MATTFEGDVTTDTDIMHRSTYQLLTSGQLFSKSVQWACFNKTPFTKAVGLEAFGVASVLDIDKFGAAEASGRIIDYDTGHISFHGSVYATTPTSYHTGRLGSHTPELVEGGHEYAYSWHELDQSTYIPETDVEDNSAGRHVDIKAQKMEGMKQTFVRDFNYAILGHASAPDYGTMGPYQVDSDLTHLISVTQSSAVAPGGLSSAGAYWKNQYKAITAIGGGGEMDRPIVLRRSMMDGLNDARALAEATNDYLLLATQGAWQYYDRLMYADTVQGGSFAVIKKYDAAGIEHYAFGRNPMVWDPAVTRPVGADASTESIYGIHIPSYKISIRTEKNFKVLGWEGPRVHDREKTHNAMIQLRYTPAVIARRPHVVFYNMPVCPD